MATAANPVVITVASATLHDIQSFEESLKRNLEDITSFSQTTAGTTESLPTTYEGDYKFSGSFNISDTAQATLRTNFLAATLTVFTLLAQGETHTFSAYITDYAIKGEAKGKINLDVSVKLNGALAIA
jgi:hypothetical protein